MMGGALLCSYRERAVGEPSWIGICMAVHTTSMAPPGRKAAAGRGGDGRGAGLRRVNHQHAAVIEYVP